MRAKKAGRAIDATLEVLEHLSYIQIDTISVIQRAHHHTLWNRNPRYKHAHLDKLQQQGKVFEYWSHAAAYLPMSDYRYYLPHKREIANGKKRWYSCDPKVKKHVLERITADGPLQAKDFERKEKGKLAMWEWKPAKYALEQLFMEGKLMIARRQGFQKVYDLESRILPTHISTGIPTTKEWCRFLIKRYLQAHGLGQAAEIAYLRQGKKGAVQSTLNEMEEQQELIRATVEGEAYYVFPESLDKLSSPLAKAKLKILSPFDNLVIQRKRMNRIFDFDYQIECYVPQEKRKFGYFCLPIIWNAQLVARMDCKADRQSNTMIIKSLTLESGLKNPDWFVIALEKELHCFMSFNQCTKLALEMFSDPHVKQTLAKRFI